MIYHSTPKKLYGRILALTGGVLLLGALGFFVFGTSSESVSHGGIIPVLSKPSAEAAVVFGGDLFFDRYIRSVMEMRGGDYVFSCLGDTLKNADLVVANLEGPVTEHESVSMGTEDGSPENFVFTFPPSVPPLLFRENVRLVNLGNNHILNFGEEGAAETAKRLRSAGVSYFGSPATDSEIALSVKGVPLAFVSYNEFGGESAEEVAKRVKVLRAERKIPIVFSHWGDEYATSAPERIKNLAHLYIDVGAEIVVGAHPHVVEEHELYRGKHIYYSLGNFIFDQYWNGDVKNGLLIKATFTGKGLSEIQEIPIMLQEDGRICLN